MSSSSARAAASFPEARKICTRNAAYEPTWPLRPGPSNRSSTYSRGKGSNGGSSSTRGLELVLEPPVDLCPHAGVLEPSPGPHQLRRRVGAPFGPDRAHEHPRHGEQRERERGADHGGHPQRMFLTHERADGHADGDRGAHRRDREPQHDSGRVTGTAPEEPAFEQARGERRAPPVRTSPPAHGQPAATDSRADASSDSSSTTPSSEPRSASLARSGWGMRPTTLPCSLAMPAMSSRLPFGFRT